MGRKGAYRVIVGTAPGAGAEWSQTVPLGKWWYIMAISLRIVQGAGQTPRPTVIITDGTNDLAQCFGASDDQQAATTCHYTWGPGLALTAHVDTLENVHANGPLPQIVVPPGGTIGSYTVGIGGNTQYSAPVITVIQYDGEPSFEGMM